MEENLNAARGKTDIMFKEAMLRMTANFLITEQEDHATTSKCQKKKGVNLEFYTQ